MENIGLYLTILSSSLVILSKLLQGVPAIIVSLLAAISSTVSLVIIIRNFVKLKRNK